MTKINLEKRMKTIINGSNEQENDYGLPDIVSSTPDPPMQDKQPNFVIQSVFGAYHEGDNGMDEECIEDTQNTPGSSDDVKPKIEENILK